ncbi:MAG TPA: NAD(P)H-dependent oxidoreductase subunit E [Candidatus Wallbacteria bacterium]|nr:NAD(P)H-dependent oxidoreductase subunit E [Candidatus Wallbacteria bacterium]
MQMKQVSSSSRKFEKVCEIIQAHGNDPAKLIPILQAVQEQYRYLPEEVMTFVATSLDISPAKVYGVATFFSHFALVPKGKHIIKVCDGTACHVKRSSDIIDAIRAKLNLTASKNTTPDMLFTLETVSCLGACGIAPVVVINDEVHGAMNREKTSELIDMIIKEEEGK